MRRRSLRAAVPVLVLGLAVLAAALLAGPPDEGVPLDPTSTGPLGAKALVELLAALDAQVAVTDELTGADTALALSARALPDGDVVDAWVAGGGVLVVADPRAELAPAVVGGTALGPVEASLPRGCRVRALASVERVHAPGAVLETPTDAQGCFTRGEGHWLVAAPHDRGHVVVLGGPDALLNRHLGRADNALLAAALLAPRPGTRVVVLRPPAPGSGEATLADLVPDRVVLAGLQLALAFLVVVAWRSRRLGAPVVESQPVRLPGSELVVAVGRLLQQARAREAAAAALRDETRRLLAEGLGLPVTASTQQVATAAAARGHGEVGELSRILEGPPPRDERELVALAGDLAALRSRLRAHSPA